MMFMLAAHAAALPFHLHEGGRDVDFHYDWPAEASAIPALKAKLTADMKRDRARTARDAAADRKAALQAGYEFHRHEHARSITLSGRTARLISFKDKGSGYTGGAHPNYGFNALLWDRGRNAQVRFGSLFARAAKPLLQPAYCQGLAVERQKKLGRPTPVGKYWETCPDPLSMALIPTDTNRNARFDQLVVIAGPYAVGSYAEGEYVVTLPVTAQLIAALKPEYRSSFEAQRQ